MKLGQKIKDWWSDHKDGIVAFAQGAGIAAAIYGTFIGWSWAAGKVGYDMGYEKGKFDGGEDVLRTWAKRDWNSLEAEYTEQGMKALEAWRDYGETAKEEAP